MLTQRRSAPLIGTALLALAGVAFSSWSALNGGSAACVSNGCALYKDITIAGISLWWFGTAAFALLVILAASGKAEAGRSIAGLGVFLDCLLLLLMAFTAPCASCLVVAALLCGTYALFRDAAAARSRQQTTAWLLLLWGALFVVNGVGLAREKMGPWLLHGPANAEVRFFFSPSCPSCKQALIALTARDANNVAFIPVAESDDDTLVIGTMTTHMANGHSVATAFQLATSGSAPAAMGSVETLRLRFNLLRNKALALGAGSDRLPLIQYNGLPSMLMPHAGTEAPAAVKTPKPATAPQTGDLPFSTDIAGSCSGDTVKTPCPDPAQ